MNFARDKKGISPATGSGLAFPMNRGRPLGSKTQLTHDVRTLARQYGPDALKALWKIATKGKSESARVLAIKEILDRAYGKSVQAIEMSGINGGPIEVYHAIEEGALTDHERAIFRRALEARAGQPVIDVESPGSAGLSEPTD